MSAPLILLAIVGTPLLIALASIWRGYVLSVLWGWFIVPQFHAPALSIPVAIGLSLIVGFLTIHKNGREAEKEMEPLQSFVTAMTIALVGPAAVLGVGWIVKQFL